MYQELKTDRLFIRPITIGDNAFIFSLMNSEGWLKFIGDRNIRNTDDAEKYIRNILNNTKYFYSVIEIHETKQPIGVLTFLHRDNQEFPDFGFAMLPEFQKQGFAYEASRSYLDALLKQTTDSEITAFTLSDNTASITLLKRVGFKWVTDKNENDEVVSYFSLAKK